MIARTDLVIQRCQSLELLSWLVKLKNTTTFHPCPLDTANEHKAWVT
jgi:hypothetical protein